MQKENLLRVISSIKAAISQGDIVLVSDMGVFGLSGFCSNHVSSASTEENLSSVARARREEGKAGTAVVVDGFGLMHALFERCMPGWQWSLGGEYLFLDAVLREWVKGLTNGGLSVVMCFDPAHGTEQDEEGHKGRKDYELISRFKERCAMLDKVDELRSCPPDMICICHDWIVV